MTKALLFLFIVLKCTWVYSQEPSYFNRIDTSTGINSNYVNKIIQRRDGFVWVGTSEGISRFDGYNYVNYTARPNDPNSLPSAWVETLFEDSQQRLWVGTDKGLARLLPDEKNFAVYKYNSTDLFSIGGDLVHDITEDDRGQIWFTSDHYINLYLEESNRFQRFPLPAKSNELDNDIGINFILFNKLSGMWVGSDLGLFQFNVDTKSFTKHQKISSVGESFYDADFDSAGNLWLATREKGVFKYNPINRQIKVFKADSEDIGSITSNYVWRLFVDSKDNVWVGARGNGISLIKSDNDSVRNFSYNSIDERTIPSNLVTDIIEDDSGIIWVGTYDGIATYQPEQVLENLRPIPYDKNSLSSELVWSFAETKNAVWIGGTEGLNREDKITGKIERYSSARPGREDQKFTAVWVMDASQQDNLWLGTEYGLVKFKLNQNKFEFSAVREKAVNSGSEHNSLLNHAVWSLEARDDGSVWVGTNNSKLYLYSSEKGVLSDLSGKIKQDLGEDIRLEINNIIEDNHKNLWLSTTVGLYVFDYNRKKIKPALNKLGENFFPQDWIYATAHHKDSLYWVSSQTYGIQLLRFNPDGTVTRVIHLDERTANFSDKNIYNVVPVSESEVWFTGQKNIYLFDIDTRELVNFGSDRLFPNVIFHENTQFKTSSNNLLFGSTKGVIRLFPEKLKSVEKNRGKARPPLYITQLETNLWTLGNNPEFISNKNQNISTTETFVQSKALHLYNTLTFSHHHNVFNFKFSALDYLNAGNMRYSYKLDGFDTGWSKYSKRREITYTNLPAGEYKLMLRASSGIHDWGDKPKILKLKILPAPWRTPTAYAGYGFIFLFVFAFVYRFWRRQLLIQYALDKSEVKLEQALWGSGDELWEWDLTTGALSKQNVFKQFELVESIDKNSFSSLMELVHPDDVERLSEQLHSVIKGETTTLEAVYRRKTKSGEWTWLLDRAKVTQFSDFNRPILLSGTTRNVDSLKQAEEKNLLLASAFQSTNDGALILNQKLEIVSINRALTRITGFDQSIVGTTYNSKLISSAKTLSDGEKLSSEIMKSILSERACSREIWIRNVKGRKIPVEMKMAAVGTVDSDESHFVITITDINFRKKAEKELRRLADYDSLTNLPNRSRLIKQLEYGILQAQRDNSLLAVLFIDLDNFKNVNDSLGHSVGDLLLVAVAQRLKHSVRRTDTVARLGGDEFTIGLLGLESIEDATHIAMNLLEAMQKPFSLNGHDLVISPSIGIAIYGDDGIDVETLLRNADIAMYHAKNHGKNNFEFFTQSMNERVFNRIALEKRVRRALENDEFILHYQPKFGLLGGEVVGFEALVRWEDPKHGLIPPNEFIPISEETGLILPLGAWVIDAACAQLNRWNELGYKNLNLAVNLSALQFQDKHLIQTIKGALDKYQIKVENFELEITESSLMENMSYTIKTLNQLREFGLKLSLDDFGTGYSSLNYLKKFPIQCLKIDRSFIRDLTSDKRDAKMVDSIVSLAHNLDLKVVGEGIEEREQLAMLHKFGIDEVQGYLLGKPTDAKTATELLNCKTNISKIVKPIKV